MPLLLFFVFVEFCVLLLFIEFDSFLLVVDFLKFCLSNLFNLFFLMRLAMPSSSRYSSSRWPSVGLSSSKAWGRGGRGISS